MKSQTSVVRSALFSVAGFVLGAGTAQNAYANPGGATVVHGSAQFAMPGANTLEITNSANAIINWQSFGIGQGEITRFIQPSADSAVLNRVTGANVSELLGNLSSNGRVFLINPHGIVVGENAVIDVAGFVASTLNLGDEDFLNGRFDFQGENAGALINRGLVTAGPGGELVLIAPQIENHGVLSVDNGALLLAAGEKVKLTRFDLNGIEFDVQAPDNRVLNLGELIARRGAVGVFAGSIDHRGIIEANALGTDAAGNIVLQARNAISIDSGASVAASGADGGDIRIQALNGDTIVSGDVEAAGNNGKGGSIQILGERVGLTAQANINASGSNDGGEILIGGDYRGLNPDVQNASATFVGEDVRLAAGATVNGDGGKVIVWADAATRVYGGISATGGSLGGDGGFVETSAHYLEVAQGPDVSAENGMGGTWLLDPYNIEVTTGSTANNSGQPLFTPTGVNSQISSLLINGQLNLGTNVVIDTVGAGAQPGNVTFTGVINKTAGGDATLTVRADGDILVNGNISSSAGLLNVDFESNRDFGDSLGGIQISSGINISTNGGFAQLVSRGVLGTGEGVLVNTGGATGSINAGTGQISIQAQTGPIDLTGATFSTLLSDNKVTLEADSFSFTNGVVSISISTAPTVEIRSFSKDVELGTNPGGGLLIDDAFFSPFNASSYVIASAAGHDVRAEQATVTFGIDTTINSGRDIIFNNSSQTGIVADDINFNLNAAGKIIDNSPGILDVDATMVTFLDLQAVDGMRLETRVSSMQYANTGTGNIDIVNSFDGGLSLLGGSNSSGGTTTIDHTSTSGGISVDGNITQSGGTLILLASGGQSFILNSSNITNNGDIDIVADDIILNSGSIDASPGGKTILKPINSRSWLLGGTSGDLTEAELNIVLNNIAVGGSSLTLTGANIVGSITFSNNQNLTIQTDSVGTILFNQNGAGIANAGQVHLITGSVANGALGSDVGANQLIIDTVSGIGSVANPLETRITELIATNTGSGEIGISNAVTNLRIAAPGVQNLATTGGNISILNNAGGIQVDGLVDSDSGDVALRAAGAGTDILVTTDVVAAANITLTAGRDLTIHAGVGPTTDARVRAGGTLNLGVGRNLTLISDTAGNTAAIVSNGTSLGTQNGIELEMGDTLTVAGTTTAGLLNMSGGSATFNGATGLTGLAMTGGTLDGTGNVNISGAATWSGGGMQGTGLTTVSGGLNINGAISLNRTLRNAGTGGIWQSAFDIGGTGTFNNLAGASLDIANDQNMTVTFNNAGTVTKSSTGTTQFNTYTQAGGVTTFAGTVAIDTLALNGGTLDGSGSVIVPTTLNWTGGTMGGTGTTTASGSLLINGAVTLNRAFNNNGSGVWQGANNIGGTGTFNNDVLAALDITNNQSMGATFNNAGTVNKTSAGTTTFATFSQTGGTTTLAGPVAIGTLNLSGGLMDGSGNIGVGTAFNWTGGGMDGTGVTIVNNGLNINGAVSLNRTLNNAGNATWQGAGDISGGGVFNNGANGVLTIANDRFMGPAFNNAGTVDKTGTGMTSFVGGYQQTAGITRLNGGTLELAEGEFLLAGGILTGTGTVTVPVLNNSGGWIAPGGYIDPVSQMPTSTDLYGSLKIDGDLQMGGSARINFDLGMSNERGGVAGTDFDLLEVTGNAQLDGTLVLVADPGSFNAFIGEGFRPVITYATRSGAFSSVSSFPVGYEFSREVLTQALGLKVTAVPLRSTDFISDDELEGLRDAFKENISRIKLERQRRRKEDEEEEKRRRAMMCS